MRKPTTEIAARLRTLGIPVRVTKERGPHYPGINVWRTDREDFPSKEFPYRGVSVMVMYEPEGESETQHSEWVEKVREFVLSEWPDRYRPFPAADILGGSSQMLVEDPDTAYTQYRTSENAKRKSLGWKPLHEIGH